MGIKEIIETELIENRKTNWVITSYNMTSDTRDESYQQTVRIAPERPGNSDEEDSIYIKDQVLPRILRKWAGEGKFTHIMSTEVISIWALGENELVDTLTVYDTDLGYYIVRTHNGMY